MEFGGAQGDVFKLPLQAGISGERAGPLGSVREGRGVRGGERGGGGERRNKETEMERRGEEERESRNINAQNWQKLTVNSINPTCKNA